MCEECLQFSNQQKVCVCIIHRVSEAYVCVAPCFVTVC